MKFGVVRSRYNPEHNHRRSIHHQREKQRFHSGYDDIVALWVLNVHSVWCTIGNCRRACVVLVLLVCMRVRSIVYYILRAGDEREDFVRNSRSFMISFHCFIILNCKEKEYYHK